VEVRPQCNLSFLGDRVNQREKERERIVLKVEELADFTERATIYSLSTEILMVFGGRMRFWNFQSLLFCSTSRLCRLLCKSEPQSVLFGESKMSRWDGTSVERFDLL